MKKEVRVKHVSKRSIKNVTIRNSDRAVKGLVCKLESEGGVKFGDCQKKENRGVLKR